MAKTSGTSSEDCGGCVRRIDMNEYEKKNLLDFIEAMTEAFRYVERGVDYFCVKAGAVEVKMDATARKNLSNG